MACLKCLHNNDCIVVLAPRAGREGETGKFGILAAARETALVSLHRNYDRSLAAAAGLPSTNYVRWYTYNFTQKLNI